MGRIIKFRGKIEDKLPWVYGSCIYDKTYDGIDVAFIVPNLPCCCEHNDFWTAKMLRVFPDSVGQFTSLYDKNHREIYEGDILQLDGCSDKLEVRFIRGVFAFLWNGNLDDEFPCNAPTQEWATVIGNIYEDPTLLGKEKE